MVADGQTVAKFYDLQRKKYAKCLYVGFGCHEKPVRAHSIQNTKVLDLLQKDNHVIVPLQKLSPETGPMTEFTLVGRNITMPRRSLVSAPSTMPSYSSWPTPSRSNSGMTSS
jgi:hypothetical protein